MIKLDQLHSPISAVQLNAANIINCEKFTCLNDGLHAVKRAVARTSSAMCDYRLFNFIYWTDITEIQSTTLGSALYCSMKYQVNRGVTQDNSIFHDICADAHLDSYCSVMD